MNYVAKSLNTAVAQAASSVKIVYISLQAKIGQIHSSQYGANSIVHSKKHHRDWRPCLCSSIDNLKIEVKRTHFFAFQLTFVFSGFNSIV